MRGYHAGAFFFSASKPVIYVCNVSEDEVSGAEGNAEVKKVREHASSSGDDVIIVFGQDRGRDS